MLTIFSTPKPFSGHIGIIQRNAIQSWMRIHPGVEIILFGDEPGAAEAAREFGLRHVPSVPRNELGTKLLRGLFEPAQRMARHDVLCYVNCDIMFLRDFRTAIEQTMKRFSHFLMVGRRWDLDVREPVDMTRFEWERVLAMQARSAHRQRPPNWIDYFGFTRGAYSQSMPPFVIGRPGWDNWLLWKARNDGLPVIDASAVVMAIHQNHDYSYHVDGEAGVWHGAEAEENYALLNGGRYFATIENSSHRLLPGGFRRNYAHWLALADRWARSRSSRVWFGALNLTRPIRQRLGWRRSST